MMELFLSGLDIENDLNVGRVNELYDEAVAGIIREVEYIFKKAWIKYKISYFSKKKLSTLKLWKMEQTETSTGLGNKISHIKIWCVDTTVTQES